MKISILTTLSLARVIKSPVSAFLHDLQGCFILLALAALLHSCTPWTPSNLSVCQGFSVPLKYHSKLVFSCRLPTALFSYEDNDPVENFLQGENSPHDNTMPPGIIQALFDKLDTSGSGKLGSSQVYQLVIGLFPESIWNERAVERLMNDIGVNNSGLIKFEEFYTWMNLQDQTKDLVSKMGARRLVVSNDHVMQLAKHFESGSSPLNVDISYEEIQDIIDVSRPYYALENEGRVINESGETIGFVAEVSPEMPTNYETGSVGVGEACRHLAIAGSIAAAMASSKKGKHYYLALDGSNRYNEVLPISLYNGIDKLVPRKPGKLRLFAYNTSINKREATSEAFLFIGDKNDDVIRINVSYKVIPAQLFQRFYPAVENINKALLEPWTPNKHNPYADDIDIFISNIKNIDNDSMLFSANMPPVCPSKCFGHFDTSPCLPIAFLLGHLVDVAGQSVNCLLDTIGAEAKPVFVVKDGVLGATAMVQAGTKGINIEGKTVLIGKGIYMIEFNLFLDDSSNDHIAFYEIIVQQK